MNNYLQSIDVKDVSYKAIGKVDKVTRSRRLILFRHAIYAQPLSNICLSYLRRGMLFWVEDIFADFKIQLDSVRHIIVFFFPLTLFNLNKSCKSLILK